MEHLPPEVLQHFLLFLAPDEVGGCALVCKGWTDVVDEDYMWKQQFARYFGGKLQKRPLATSINSDDAHLTWKQTCTNALNQVHNAIMRVLDKQTRETFTPKDSMKLILEPSEMLVRHPCVLLAVVEQLALNGYSTALQRVLAMPIRGKYNAIVHAFAMSSAGGHLEQLQWILGLEPELEIDYVHKHDDHYTTALQLAVEHNHPDVVRFLLQKGAKNTVSQRTCTARGYRLVSTKSACAIAIKNGQTDILRLFLDPYAPTTTTTTTTLTTTPTTTTITTTASGNEQQRGKELHGFLEEAVKASNVTAVRLILDVQNPTCSINHLSGLSASDGVCVPLSQQHHNNNNNTTQHTPATATLPKLTPIGSLLFFAAMTGDVEIARLLLSRGADVNLSTSHNRTALHVASYYGHADMVAFLIANGANTAATTIDGVTPISAASWQGHDNLLAILLAQELVKRKGKG
eukprot:TRINITY_DN3119_c0_g1_i1.p1 TRINITY_DN3119_c0_g1~~TRINITY_DN3119_c0_g1_i1.p1  ORF type:complete len:461 (-),score=87.20 TRINITY_DN3119_c0_g1_i1:28-1410(-)